MSLFCLSFQAGLLMLWDRLHNSQTIVNRTHLSLSYDKQLLSTVAWLWYSQKIHWHLLSRPHRALHILFVPTEQSILISHNSCIIFGTEVRFLYAYACPLLGSYPQVQFCTLGTSTFMLNLEDSHGSLLSYAATIKDSHMHSKVANELFSFYITYHLPRHRN
jgi:hypothetical protein